MAHGARAPPLRKSARELPDCQAVRIPVREFLCVFRSVVWFWTWLGLGVTRNCVDTRRWLPILHRILAARHAEAGVAARWHYGDWPAHSHRQRTRPWHCTCAGCHAPLPRADSVVDTRSPCMLCSCCGACITGRARSGTACLLMPLSLVAKRRIRHTRSERVAVAGAPCEILSPLVPRTTKR